ncbi:MAG: hypothetical protein ACTSXX_02185 [Candidatus Baldrarchaeia archaeon]
MEKICRLDPFGRTKCHRDEVNFEICLLCQLYWIRGILYRLVLDFETYAKITVVDVIERILKRELSDDERKRIEEMYREGKILTEILEELKKPIKSTS